MSIFMNSTGADYSGCCAGLEDVTALLLGISAGESLRAESGRQSQPQATAGGRYNSSTYTSAISEAAQAKA